MADHRRRLLRLEAWLIRAIIPEGMIGAYLLFTCGRPNYAGRSDTNLQGRLITHALAGRGKFFDYDIYEDDTTAFHAECGLYHALGDQLVNLIHPAVPSRNQVPCLICGYPRVQSERLKAPCADPLQIDCKSSPVTTPYPSEVETRLYVSELGRDGSFDRLS